MSAISFPPDWPNGPHDFATLMSRLGSGDGQAVRELIDNYGEHLLRVVRLRLHRSLRSQFDSRDFVQDVWASFFADLPRDRVFQKPEDLVAFLARIAQNKVAEVARQRLQTAKYNRNREQSLDDPRTSPNAEPAALQPTPSQVAMSREEWERLLNSQNPMHRRMLVSLRDGKTPTQVAQELGVHVRTVRRLIEKLLPGYYS